MDGRVVENTVSKDQAFSIRKANFTDEISFYAPGLKRYSTMEFQQENPKAFVPISLTGDACALQCDHCKAKILFPMIALNTKEGLFNLCSRLAASGTEGVLISGGSLRSGGVPILKYKRDIQRIKQELNLRVMVHTGVASKETAEALKWAEVDGVMIDIIGANKTIRDVYHLDLTVQDFEDSLRHLVKCGLSVRPHIILGLHYGQFIGEETALNLIAQFPVHALVLVILTPLVETPMAGIDPPQLNEIEDFFVQSRITLPYTKIMLGCARPTGDFKIQVDHAAVDSGLNGIAYPADGIIEYSSVKGLQPKFFENSCSCGCE